MIHPEQCCACRRRSPLSDISTRLPFSQSRGQTAVSWVQLHWLETFDSFQYRASPLPQATHLAKACKLGTVLCDRRRVPVLEPYIGLFKVRENIGGYWTSVGAGAVD